MSKGIIVVDIPENCLNCDLRSATGYCLPGHKDILEMAMNRSKPKDCPIKHFPKKKLPRKLTPSPMVEDYYTAYDQGWNDCLSKMIGESE